RTEERGMTSRKRTLACIAAAVVVAAGCQTDLGKAIGTDPQMRDQVMNAISTNSELTGQMLDKLIGGDATRKIVVEKVMANGSTVQQLMSHIAQDQTMVDGILGVAVQ